MEKEKLIKEAEDFGAYEDFTEDDFFSESWDLSEDHSEIGEFDLDDFGIYDVDEGLESEECDEPVCKPLTEDLISSFPVRTMSESQVRDAAKKVVKGAKVKFKYVKELYNRNRVSIAWMDWNKQNGIQERQFIKWKSKYVGRNKYLLW